MMASAGDAWRSSLDAFLERALRDGAAPGLAAVVGNGDALLYEGAVGLRDEARRLPMTGDTVFWLASCTKLVTSVAALQLVDRGLIALDEPIDPLLPDLADYRVLDGFTTDGAPILRAPKRRITLRHLLTHGAGLGYDLMNADLIRARGSAGPIPATTLASLRGPLLFDPGEGWAYGNATDWVGLAIEAATGRRLDAHLEAAIFAPLEMRATGFDLPSEKAAQLCNRTPAGRFEAIPSPLADRGAWQYISGSSGLYGTIGDFARLLRALLDARKRGTGRILGEEMRRALFDVATGAIRAGSLSSVVPAMNAPFDLFPDMPTGWSLGGLVNPRDVPGRRRAGSLGWAGLANTYYWIDPQSDIYAVLTAQHLPFADPAMIATQRGFEEAVYAES